LPLLQNGINFGLVFKITSEAISVLRNYWQFHFRVMQNQKWLRSNYLIDYEPADGNPSTTSVIRIEGVPLCG